MEIYRTIKAGATSQSITFPILDPTAAFSGSYVADGVLAYNTTGLTASYTKDKTAPVAIALATLAAITSAYSSGGFIQATGGDFRLDLPDAAISTVGQVVVNLSGATNANSQPIMVPVKIIIACVAYDPSDAVHLGLSC